MIHVRAFRCRDATRQQPYHGQAPDPAERIVVGCTLTKKGEEEEEEEEEEQS
jgi:hypothetical protein